MSHKHFDGVEPCVQYIQQQSSNKRIILIVGCYDSRQIIPLVDNLHQVRSILIYSMHKNEDQQWAKNYKKIMSVEHSHEEVIQRIVHEQEKIQKIENQTMMPTSIFRSKRKQSNHGKSSMDINGSFIFFQSFIEALLRMPSNEDEFVEYLYTRYAINSSYVDDINKFKTDRSSYKALRWYTSDSLFYRVLNQALRNEDIYNIYRLRWFIQQLYLELDSLQQKSDYGLTKVYRFQLISNDELQKLQLSINDHISMSSFLSTSANKEYVFSLLPSIENEINILNTENLVPLILEISIDETVIMRAQPFAKISDISYFPDEKESLFMLGSIFTIESVNAKHVCNSQYWLMRLRLCGKDNYSLKEVFDHIKDTMQSETDIFSLCDLLCIMGKHDEAQYIYEEAMSKISANDFLTNAKCCQGLSDVYREKGDYDSGIIYAEKALLLYHNIPMQDSYIADCYRSLSICYRRKMDEQHTLEYMKKALETYQSIYGEDHLKTALMYLIVGTTFSDFGKKVSEYNIALVFMKKALEYFENKFGNNHRYVSLAYCNIGVTYWRLKQYDTALNYYEKQLEIQQRTLPINHFEFGVTYLNMGEVYEDRGEYSQALMYYEEARKIFNEASLSSAEPCTSGISESSDSNGL
ncbi:hypothetical protein I4U23_014568 [Adineta vaga]|nr:hypothetical protein I4U23_014568 [Adineta vaga]